METVNLGNPQGSVGTGDHVIVRQEYAIVVSVHTERGGAHNRATVPDNMTALVVTTDRGQRAIGVRDAWIGSDLRMHWQR